MNDYVPEAGVECTLKNYGLISRITPRYISKEFIVFTQQGIEGEIVSGLTGMKFEPIGTQQYIEREEAIAEIDELLSRKDIMQTSGEYLYDAGYRLVGEKAIMVEEVLSVFKSFDGNYFACLEWLDENLDIYRKVAK